MTERKKIVIGGRQQGKTLEMQEKTKEAIERGKKLYLSESPPIAEDDRGNGELDQEG